MRIEIIKLRFMKLVICYMLHTVKDDDSSFVKECNLLMEQIDYKICEE